eukprot:2736294-Rhodomonas_salina.2
MLFLVWSTHRGLTLVIPSSFPFASRVGSLRHRARAVRRSELKGRVARQERTFLHSNGTFNLERLRQAISNDIETVGNLVFDDAPQVVEPTGWLGRRSRKAG